LLLAQGCPEGQTLPQAPQLFVSFVVPTQLDPHSVCPLGHAQLPELHDWAEGQTLPQPPQLFSSLAVFTQLPVQTV
jgi:hypothetical protein